MDITTILESCDPASEADVPGHDSVLAQQIRRDVMSVKAGESPERRFAPRTGLTRRFPVVPAVVFTTVIALVIALLTITGPRPEPVSPSQVVKALDKLASVAADQSPVVGPGRYYYTDIDEVYLTSIAPTYTAYIVANAQSWVATSGSSFQVIRDDLTPHFVTAADRTAWVREGRPPVATPPFDTTQHYGPGAPGAPPLYNVSGLPSDPKRLYAILNTEYPGNTSDGRLPHGIAALDLQGACDMRACTLFERTAALLQGPAIGMTPAFRAALYDVLAMVPGIRFLGQVDDPIGQPGTGFRFVDSVPATTVYYSCANGLRQSPKPFPGSRQQKIPAQATIFTVVINPSTAALMSQEESFSPLVQRSRVPLLNCTASRSTVDKAAENTPLWDVVLRSGVVNSESATPAS